MKTSVITLFLSFLLVTSMNASPLSGDNKNDNNAKRTERIIRKAIDRAMIFPIEQEGKEMQGTVDVSFQINEKGKIKVVNIESSNTELMDYVLEKLNKIKLDNARTEEGQTIRYKFVFKQQT